MNLTCLIFTFIYILKDVIFDEIFGEFNKNATSFDFSEQSLICFDIDDRSRRSNNSKVLTIDDISSIFSSERNMEGFIYMVQRLDEKGHLTWPTNGIRDTVHNSTFYSEERKSISFCHIPKETSYVSENKEIVVLNNDDHCRQLEGINTSYYSSPIDEATSLVTELFELGIHRFFQYDNKKRSKEGTKKNNDNVRNKVVRSLQEGRKTTTIKPDALPTITLGWTQIDANEYRHNHSTVAGTIKPFLRNGGVTKTISRKLIEIVEMTLSVLPPETCFSFDKMHDEFGRRQIRQELAADLKEYLGGNRDTSNFRVEGIAVLIPLTIGYHMDTLNCSVEGMQSVVCVNAKIPINDNTLPTKQTTVLRKWLEENGYHSSFPVSIILYSRSCVGSYVEKLVKNTRLSNSCSLHQAVSWALMKRVDTAVDYLSRIFESESYVEEFQRKAKISKDSYFGYKLHKSVACYNRMVSQEHMLS